MLEISDDFKRQANHWNHEKDDEKHDKAAVVEF